MVKSGNLILDWLLDSDVSIQYQVWRDLLNEDRKDLQLEISKQGWGKSFLDKQHEDGHWGDRFYQPKWISTHYTLLDLRNINIHPDNPRVRMAINDVFTNSISKDGGIRLGPSTAIQSDVCVNGMFLNYASYFGASEKDMSSVVDSLLNETMPDGGFNCEARRTGSKHSSMHTTLSVIEGFVNYLKNGNAYRKKEVNDAIQSAKEFLLKHHLYRSDKTNEVINSSFLSFKFPVRWQFDILRALDCFRYAGFELDDRMNDALNIVKNKSQDGKWKLPAAHPGKVHFVMETAGKPSRWNTLRALRVLRYFGMLEPVK